MSGTAAILAPLGQTLSDWETAFFRDADPWGFILFARNIETPDQLRRLTADLRASVGRDAPILIDQEGGRVQRMRAPHWREYLPAFEQMAQARDPLRAFYLRNRLIAAELHAVGIDVNCAPLGDVANADTHPILQNRTYGTDAGTVADAAKICAQAHLDGGVLPVLKHIPGHGRAVVDSHLELPRTDAPADVLWASEFQPFKALADLPLGMTAHVVFEAFDPTAPATTSPIMHRLIRDDIGFSGLLMTDDLSMQALKGCVSTRTRAALDAGCDLILHCNGDADEMRAIAKAAGPMTDAAKKRGETALNLRKPAAPIDIGAVEAELAGLLS